MSGVARVFNGRMKNLAAFLLGIALCAALLFFAHVQLPLTLVATVAAGIGCLAWLVVIVVLPWNLYFQARHLRFELQRSRSRGIVVSDSQEVEARTVARRMLRVSIALHLVSAALLTLGSWLYDEPLGYAFAGLYLLSTLFRPAVEYYRYVRARLSDALDEVKYPRDDIQKLVGEVRALTEGARSHDEALTTLRTDLSQLSQAMLHGDREAQRKLDSVARRFEETIDRLTDNQEIISGIKAFLRLVQTPRREATVTGARLEGG